MSPCSCSLAIASPSWPTPRIPATSHSCNQFSWVFTSCSSFCSTPKCSGSLLGLLIVSSFPYCFHQFPARSSYLWLWLGPTVPSLPLEQGLYPPRPSTSSFPAAFLKSKGPIFLFLSLSNSPVQGRVPCYRCIFIGINTPHTRLANNPSQ